MQIQGLSTVFITVISLNCVKAMLWAQKTNSGIVPLSEDLINYKHKRQLEFHHTDTMRDLMDYLTETSESVDIRGLYSTLKYYPDLMERRLILGGQTPPTSQPNSHINSIEQIVNKRSGFDIGLAQPACPFTTQWVRLYHARDINNTEVEVFQPSDNSNRYQWFYTVTCDYDSMLEEDGGCHFCCKAINHRRYASRCIPRKSYVMALIRKSPVAEFDWGYIQVDSSCNCAISLKA